MGLGTGLALIALIIYFLWWLICWICSGIWWLICNVLPVVLAVFLLLFVCVEVDEYRKGKKNKIWGEMTICSVLGILIFMWMNAVWDWHVFGDNNDNNVQEQEEVRYVPKVESHSAGSSVKIDSKRSSSSHSASGRSSRSSSSSRHSSGSYSSGSHYNSDYEDGYEAGFEDGYHEDSYDRHRGSSSSYDDGYQQGYYDGAYEGGGGGFWDD